MMKPPANDNHNEDPEFRLAIVYRLLSQGVHPEECEALGYNQAEIIAGLERIEDIEQRYQNLIESVKDKEGWAKALDAEEVLASGVRYTDEDIENYLVEILEGINKRISEKYDD